MNRWDALFLTQKDRLLQARPTCHFPLTALQAWVMSPMVLGET
jgi:hypothetical protein